MGYFRWRKRRRRTIQTTTRTRLRTTSDRDARHVNSRGSRKGSPNPRPSPAPRMPGAKVDTADNLYMYSVDNLTLCYINMKSQICFKDINGSEDQTFLHRDKTVHQVHAWLQGNLFNLTYTGKDLFCVGIDRVMYCSLKHIEIDKKGQENQHWITQGNGLLRCGIRQVYCIFKTQTPLTNIYHHEM